MRLAQPPRSVGLLDDQGRAPRYVRDKDLTAAGPRCRRHGHRRSYSSSISGCCSRRSSSPAHLVYDLKAPDGTTARASEARADGQRHQGRRRSGWACGVESGYAVQVAAEMVRKSAQAVGGSEGSHLHIFANALGHGVDADPSLGRSLKGLLARQRLCWLRPLSERMYFHVALQYSGEAGKYLKETNSPANWRRREG